MNTTNDLDTAAEGAREAHRLIGVARQAIKSGKTEDAIETLNTAQIAAWQSMKAAIRAGALEPKGTTTKEPTPLALLDTPANRRLLVALQDAVDAAGVVDKERGHSPTDGFAAHLSALTTAVHLEINGPVGSPLE